MLRSAAYCIAAVMSFVVVVASGISISDASTQEPFSIVSDAQNGSCWASGLSVVTSTEVVPSNTYSGHSSNMTQPAGAELAVSLIAPIGSIGHTDNRAGSYYAHQGSANHSDGVATVTRGKSDTFTPTGIGLTTMAMAIANTSMAQSRSTGSSFIAIARNNYSAQSAVRMAAPGGSGPPPPGPPPGPALPIKGDFAALMFCIMTYALIKGVNIKKLKSKRSLTIRE